jgi:hypothetical protein
MEAVFYFGLSFASLPKNQRFNKPLMKGGKNLLIL